MGKQAKDALQKETMTVEAEKGYFKGEAVAPCVECCITLILPKYLS